MLPMAAQSLNYRMQNTHSIQLTIDWKTVTAEMNGQGFSIVPAVLAAHQCEELICNYSNPVAFRKTIVMERYRFGLGEYKYYKTPLPDLLQTLREQLYPQLAIIANHWMQLVNMDVKFPDTFEGMQRLCHENKQDEPTVLILKYGPGGYNTLHQDLYGTVYFPMQAVFFLNEPDVEYTGGEFVLLQQVPRAQSKAIVLKPKKGDMLVFTTNFRPVKGSKGYYRANMKHGVSQVHSGERHTVGIIFHDAPS